MSVDIIGVISDTHGLLRPEAVTGLRGCELIIHAGDVGKMNVLDELRCLAPTVAVRGNIDHGAWAQSLPLSETLSVSGITVHVLHDLNQLDLNPSRLGIRVVISGHSHRPNVEEKAGVLYLNPGAAGPRRFRLPVTLCRMEIGVGERLVTDLVDLLA